MIQIVYIRISSQSSSLKIFIELCVSKKTKVPQESQTFIIYEQNVNRVSAHNYFIGATSSYGLGNLIGCIYFPLNARQYVLITCYMMLVIYHYNLYLSKMLLFLTLNVFRRIFLMRQIRTIKRPKYVAHVVHVTCYQLQLPLD